MLSTPASVVNSPSLLDQLAALAAVLDRGTPLDGPALDTARDAVHAALDLARAVGTPVPIDRAAIRQVATRLSAVHLEIHRADTITGSLTHVASAGVRAELAQLAADMLENSNITVERLCEELEALAGVEGARAPHPGWRVVDGPPHAAPVDALTDVRRRLEKTGRARGDLAFAIESLLEFANGLCGDDLAIDKLSHLIRGLDVVESASKDLDVQLTATAEATFGVVTVTTTSATSTPAAPPAADLALLAEAAEDVAHLAELLVECAADNLESRDETLLRTLKARAELVSAFAWDLANPDKGNLIESRGALLVEQPRTRSRAEYVQVARAAVEGAA